MAGGRELQWSQVEHIPQDGASPLFLAAQNGHPEVLSLLLSSPGLSVDRQRSDGASPLWIAAQMGHEECVRLLLRHGARVDLARSDGATPLFKACHKGHEEVVKEILKYNPRLDTLQNGWTCLHAAALSGRSSLVLALLEAGADPHLVNCAGLTALDLALGSARAALVRVTSRARSSSPRIQRPCTPPPASSRQSPGSRPLSSSSPNTPARSKLSVTFNDPPLQKHGGLVTKVQCRMLDRRDVVCREGALTEGHYAGKSYRYFH